MDTPQPSPTRRLLRSRTNRVIGGVCAGLGEYFQLDPTIVRIIFAALVFGGGFGVGLYILLWIFIPEAGAESADLSQRVTAAGKEIQSTAENFAQTVRSENGRSTAQTLFGVALIVIGVGMVIDRISPWHIWRGDFFWPIIVVAFGAWLMFRKS